MSEDPRASFERAKAMARGETVSPQATITALRPPSEPEKLLDYLAELNIAIEQAETIAEALPLKDYADAVRWLTRKRDLDRQTRNLASESVIRAERRLGELLLEMQKNSGGNPNLLQSAKGLPLTYAEMGIEPTAAHRWQTVAKLDAEKFEAFIQDTHDSDWELTSGGMLMYARNSLKGNAPVGPRPPDIELDGSAAQVLWDLVGAVNRAGRLVLKGWWR